MKKEFGVQPFLFPMPTYMVVTYNEDESVDAMAMAWGGICAENMVALNLEEDHKTVTNLKARGAFTLSVPGRDTLAESDFLGIASANQIPEKFSVTGLHAEKSTRVDAPIITEYPLTLECKVVEMQDQPYGLRVLGEIVNVLAEESVLDEEGKIDCGKLNTFLFDQMRSDYYAVGEVCGKAWHSGAPFVKKARNG
ncbi:MAG: flavin reductase family protein [Oscillospiraceae bacterium]|nr:flavin reductase family protein [Oscillospiraceae bacterium]